MKPTLSAFKLKHVCVPSNFNKYILPLSIQNGTQFSKEVNVCQVDINNLPFRLMSIAKALFIIYGGAWAGKNGEGVGPQSIRETRRRGHHEVHKQM